MKENINGSNGKKPDSADTRKNANRASLQLGMQMAEQKMEQKGLPTAPRRQREPVSFYMGIDPGDKKSNCRIMDDRKEIRAEEYEPRRNSRLREEVLAAAVNL